MVAATPRGASHFAAAGLRPGRLRPGRLRPRPGDRGHHDLGSRSGTPTELTPAAGRCSCISAD
eukprot:12484557-Alexandrium_andersonii.AAC.1